MSTQEEVEGLHKRVADFVLQYLRTQGNPAIHARPLVHCKVGVTHLVVPLSGVNDMTWTSQLAQAMEKTFAPDGHLRTRALPDASQFIYELVVPLTAGMTGRHRSKHRTDQPMATATRTTEAGFMENPLTLLLLFLGLVFAATAGWLLVDKI